jgi:transcriptional regulator with XRE-family HTH domain
MGTTQSAVARLESGHGNHSPSLATLRKYAHALGCRLDLRLVKETGNVKAERVEPVVEADRLKGRPQLSFLFGGGKVMGEIRCLISYVRNAALLKNHGQL